MRSPRAAAAALLLLWLAALTFAFHGSFVGGETRNYYPLSLPRKMLLAVESFHAASSSSSSAADHKDQQRHHHHHHHQQHHHGKWNRQGIPPSVAAGGGNGKEVDPRYGAEKRLVPTGPNPLHH